MHPSETAINDYADGTLDVRERAEIDRHLDACTACRQVIDDLREIKGVAASLDLREPPVRSWTRLERAIRLEAESQSTQNPQNSQKVLSLRVPRVLRATSTRGWLAAAAAIVVATFVGLKFMPNGARQPAQPPTVDSARTAPAPDTATGTTAAQSVETELRQAEDHYEKAIKGLERIANAEQNVFDPRTAATLQKNLAVIDQAISESRAALRAEPASEPAQQSLLESFQAKIGLLQDTVALINEMRKGNDAGAARIVSGLKQKGD